jgi:hypothetical protein
MSYGIENSSQAQNAFISEMPEVIVIGQGSEHIFFDGFVETIFN